MSFRSVPALSLARLLLAAGAITSLAAAQTNTSHKTVWDGAYSEAQATRGVAAFSLNCGGCHALDAGGKAPLVGDAFWKSFALKNVADLLEFVTDYMPNGKPHSLSDAAYEDIVAYILKSNGFPAGTAELAPATSAGVQIIERDGSTALPNNALARIVGCLAKNGPDWVVKRATNPVRAESATGDGAKQPLGSRTMTLKYVVTRIDQWAGSRVVVNGLLMGADGVDGINVTSVNRVADKCP
jgi:mono/diheme cytochrome c family protein